MTTKCGHLNRPTPEWPFDFGKSLIGVDGRCSACGQLPAEYEPDPWKFVDTGSGTWGFVSQPPKDRCENPVVLVPAEWSGHLDGTRLSRIPSEPCALIREPVGHLCEIPDRILIEYLRRRGFVIRQQDEFIRASGDCICPTCGKDYYHHQHDPNAVDWEGHPFLHILCDGTRVKL